MNGFPPLPPAITHPVPDPSVGRPPFFILGCPRSGTTILRDLLRQHNNLVSPEETHFYRWSYAFQAPRYAQLYAANRGLLLHRKIDGISTDDFNKIFESARSRREAQDLYMQVYKTTIDKPYARWFDKTPQNVYGLLLLSADYPEAKFLHLHRNPVNVIASLMRGEVMSKQSLNAAINWWTESVTITRQFQAAFGGRLLDIRYASLMEAPAPELERILSFVGEGMDGLMADLTILRPERASVEGTLDWTQIEEILARCGPLMDQFGYSRDIAAYK